MQYPVLSTLSFPPFITLPLFNDSSMSSAILHFSLSFTVCFHPFFTFLLSILPFPPPPPKLLVEVRTEMTAGCPQMLSLLS